MYTFPLHPCCCENRWVLFFIYHRKLWNDNLPCLRCKLPWSLLTTTRTNNRWITVDDNIKKPLPTGIRIYLLHIIVTSVLLFLCQTLCLQPFHLHLQLLPLSLLLRLICIKNSLCLFVYLSLCAVFRCGFGEVLELALICYLSWPYAWTFVFW